MSKPIIQLNEESVKSELKELVRNSVEETLNELLNKEAEELTSAAKYERTEARQGYRSGHYSRKLTTTSGGTAISAVPMFNPKHRVRRRKHEHARIPRAAHATRRRRQIHPQRIGHPAQEQPRQRQILPRLAAPQRQHDADDHQRGREQNPPTCPHFHRLPALFRL